MTLHVPDRIPEPGFYRHRKHDPAKGATHMTYYVFGVGPHTEDDCAPRDRAMLSYLPLYKSDDFPAGPYHFNRPLEMFYDPAIVDGKPEPRFIRVTDAATIERLRQTYREMYPEPF